MIHQSIFDRAVVAAAEPRTKESPWKAALFAAALVILGPSVANAAGSGGKYPAPSLTPGKAFTPAVSLTKLCTAGYTKTVRSVSSNEKQLVFQRYHMKNVPGAYEVDHFISLELGGSNDVTNLWPEPYGVTWGARVKDRLENVLHKRVCSGQEGLTQAQYEITHDWVKAYQKYIGPTP
jgi:hypothetical protein